jgi:hypothetical protein
MLLDCRFCGSHIGSFLVKVPFDHGNILWRVLSVLVVLATFGVSATDDGGAAAGLGALRFHRLVSNNRVPVRTMQSLYFTVTVPARKNAVHP